MAATEGEQIVPATEGDRIKMQRLIKIRENLQKSIDAYAVILVLLVSITYIGVLQPPGSFDEGGLIGTSSRLRSFVYCNSLSFFFSIIDLLLCVSGNPDLNLEETNDGHTLARPVVHTLIKLLGVNLLFVVSLSCCVAAYISAGFVVQKLNITDLENIKNSSAIGAALYIVFIILLLFLFTLPTLQFFSTASTCCDVGSHSPCSWKIRCGILERYLKKLDEKLLDRKGASRSESSEGGNLSSPTTIHQEKEAEQQNGKQSDGASTSNADSRGKARATGSPPCETMDKNPEISKRGIVIEEPQ